MNADLPLIVSLLKHPSPVKTYVHVYTNHVHAIFSLFVHCFFPFIWGPRGRLTFAKERVQKSNRL